MVHSRERMGRKYGEFHRRSFIPNAMLLVDTSGIRKGNVETYIRVEVCFKSGKNSRSSLYAILIAKTNTIWGRRDGT